MKCHLLTHTIPCLFKDLPGIVMICVVIANLTSTLLSDPYHPFYDLGLILKTTVSPSTKLAWHFLASVGKVVFL